MSQENLREAIEWLLRGVVEHSTRRVGLRVLHRERQWDLMVYKGRQTIAINNLVQAEWEDKVYVENSFTTDIPISLCIAEVADGMCKIFDKEGLVYRMKTMPGEVLRIRIDPHPAEALGPMFLNNPENTAESFL